MEKDFDLESLSLAESLAWMTMSVRLLASPWEIQVKSVPKGIPAADEMALDFDSAWGMKWVLEEQGVLREELEHLGNSLDQLLSDMSGEQNAHLWTEEALRSNPIWDEVRSRAANLLAELERIDA